MLEDGEWGGEPEIVEFSEFYNGEYSFFLFNDMFISLSHG